MPIRGYRSTPAYPGQMMSRKSPSGTPLYKDEAQPKWRKEKRVVYIIKGGKLGSWRGYNADDAKANVAKYGGKLTSKSVTSHVQER